MAEHLKNLQIDEFVTILDTISDAIFIDSADGNTLWINKACEDLYKISLSDIAGKHVSFLEKEGMPKL